MTLVSKERAILFADVTDSTAIYELLGDKPAAKAIDACLAVVGEVVVGWKGTVVKTIGDEIMAAFPSASAACEAAKSMQAAVSTMPASGGVKFAIKVGFHFGQVLEDRMDFWGDGVNTASRLAGLARRGQILTSGASVEKLSAALRSATRDLDAHNLKGKQDSLHVFEVVWEEDLDSTQFVTRTRAPEIQARLVLAHPGAKLEFPPGLAVLWMGRDAECELVIMERTASRRHARIERHDTQFFLVDDSTNGTYVSIESDREVWLRREQVLLRGRGRISLGQPALGAVDVVTFECI